MHVPLHDLLHRLDELPSGEELWIHCAGGYRASIASSILSAHGHKVVHVDDSFDRAASVGLPVVTR